MAASPLVFLAPRPAPRRSSATLAMMVTTARVARIEAEAKALGTAINAMGQASIEEIRELETLIDKVTSSCEACRARALQALREMGR